MELGGCGAGALLLLSTLAGTSAIAGASAAVARSAHSATRSPGCSGPITPDVGPGRVQVRGFASATNTISPGSTASSEAGPGTYLIATPHRLDHRHPLRLVLVFYGFSSNPTQFASLTGLPRRGAAAGDLVVVPHTTGTESEWQFSGNGSDATFVSALITSLEQTYCINQREIFATGFSAGAAFTIIYACSHQGQLAAIATVAVDFQLGCTKPLPIMAFHGTADPAVPYRNGAVGLSLPGVKVRGTELNMGDWARLNHCSPSPGAARIGTQVRQQLWTGCTPSTSVTLFSIEGGGHTWPGADPHKSLGLTTQQVSATSKILGFFASVGGARR
jgi:polyhydroxybutyrate depolymerase